MGEICCCQYLQTVQSRLWSRAVSMSLTWFRHRRVCSVFNVSCFLYFTSFFYTFEFVFSSSAATGQSLSPSTNAEAGPGGGGRSDAQAESLRGRAPRGRSLGPDARDDPGTGGGGGVSVRSCREKSRGVWSLLPEATPRTVLCSRSRSWRRSVDSGTSPCAFPSSPTFTGTPRETHPSLYPKKDSGTFAFFPSSVDKFPLRKVLQKYGYLQSQGKQASPVSDLFWELKNKKQKENQSSCCRCVPHSLNEPKCIGELVIW